jgi:hypothetical protein
MEMWFLWKDGKRWEGKEIKIDEKKADVVYGYLDHAIVCYHDMSISCPWCYLTGSPHSRSTLPILGAVRA